MKNGVITQKGDIVKTLLDVKNIFEKEYSSLLSKFNTFELSIKDAYKNGTKEVNSPGVYVFWHPQHGVIKVGKSQSNSKKRSLEHIHDNTHNGDINMNILKNDNDAILLLFNIKSDADIHWLLSLEAYMEWNTSPAIPAGRMG